RSRQAPGLAEGRHPLHARPAGAAGRGRRRRRAVAPRPKPALMRRVLALAACGALALACARPASPPAAAPAPPASAAGAPSANAALDALVAAARAEGQLTLVWGSGM